MNKLTLNTQEIINKLARSEDLNSDEATHLMSQALEGALSQDLMLSWLTFSDQKAYTVEEIVSYAKIMKKKAKNISLDIASMDTCGTGGDQSHLINISTLAGITLASLGIPIAKHGNRSISSRSGSADLLESFGYPLNETAEQTSYRIKKDHFGFMYAPNYHPAMKHVAAVRKELATKTIFNILGPLCNPASTKIQLLGVYSKDILDLVAESLKELDINYALIVSSQDGLDEISPLAKTEYRLLQDKNITSGWITPPPSLNIHHLDEIRVTDSQDAYNKAKNTLKGVFISGLEILVLNVTAGLFLWKLSKREIKSTNTNIQEFINNYFDRIKKHIQAGKAWELVKSWDVI